MGFFSFTTADTKVSISNAHSKNGALPVAVLIPLDHMSDYEALIEREYDGYGVFEGVDIYELLFFWNVDTSVAESTPRSEWRNKGISIAGSDEDREKLEFPLKIVSLEGYEKHGYTYENMEGESLNCKKQGYFY